MLRMACDAYFLDVVDVGIELEETAGRYNAGASMDKAREGSGPTARRQDRLELGRYDG